VQRALQPMRACLLPLLALLVMATTGGSLRAQVAPSATSMVRGIVLDSTGAPVAGAEIDLVGTALRAVANDSGAFRLEGVPANARALRVRRLGFAAAVVNLPTTLAAVHEVRIRLARTTATLEAVTVEGEFGKWAPRSTSEPALAEADAAAARQQASVPGVGARRGHRRG
jgi:hypothetical protein